MNLIIPYDRARKCHYDKVCPGCGKDMGIKDKCCLVCADCSREYDSVIIGENMSKTFLDIKTDEVRDVLKVQMSPGNYNYDQYMYGMANGLACALAILTGEEPEFAPKVDEWLCNKIPTIATIKGEKHEIQA